MNEGSDGPSGPGAPCFVEIASPLTPIPCNQTKKAFYNVYNPRLFGRKTFALCVQQDKGDYVWFRLQLGSIERKEF